MFHVPGCGQGYNPTFVPPTSQTCFPFQQSLHQYKVEKPQTRMLACFLHCTSALPGYIDNSHQCPCHAGDGSRQEGWPSLYTCRLAVGPAGLCLELVITYVAKPGSSNRRHHFPTRLLHLAKFIQLVVSISSILQPISAQDCNTPLNNKSIQRGHSCSVVSFYRNCPLVDIQISR